VANVYIVLVAVTIQIWKEGQRTTASPPFFAQDGTLQRYAPSQDPLSSSLVLERFEPSVSASPEETSGRWVAVGYVTPLSDEERRRLMGPLITPIPDPTPPPILVNVPPALPQTQPEGFDVAPPMQPLPGFDPAPPLTVEDVIVNQVLLDELVVESQGHVKGTDAHRAAAWDRYLARGGEWDYDRWATTYELNQTRALEANAAADSYHSAVG
jgi:hypothetical protein